MSAHTILAVDTGTRTLLEHKKEFESLGYLTLRVETMRETIFRLSQGEEFKFILINEDTIPNFMYNISDLCDVARMHVFITSHSYSEGMMISPKNKSPFARPRVKAFDERTGAVERDLAGLKDYVTEEYGGKRDDVRAAVAELTRFGADEGTPSEKRGVPMEVADLIAGFYGMDLDPDDNPA